MKNFKFIFGIFAILAIAFFGKSLFAIGTGIKTAALLPALTNMSEGDKQTLAFAIQDALQKESPSAIGIHTGENNPAISFSGGGASSFVDEFRNQSKMIFRLVNSTDTMQRIVLNPAYFNTFGLVTKEVACPAITSTQVTIAGTQYTVISTLTQHNETVVIGYIQHDTAAINANGLDVNGVVDDATIITDSDKSVVCSSLSRGTVQDFLKFVRKNPTRVTEMTISSNNVTQYTRKLTIKGVNPTRDFGERYIYMEDSFSNMQNRIEKIVIDLKDAQVSFDDQTLIVFELEAAIDSTHPTTTDITLKFGATLNRAHELFNLADKAKRVMNAASMAWAKLTGNPA